MSRFEDNQEPFLPEPAGIPIPEWLAWIIPGIFFIVFWVGAFVTIKFLLVLIWALL